MAELEGCLVAKEALTQALELGVSVRALERRIDRDEGDRRRLGERVTEIAEQVDVHEALSNEAVKQLNGSLAALEKMVSNMEKVIQAAVLHPPMPAGAAIMQSWRETPLPAKAKLTSAIIGVLMAPEVLKTFGKFLMDVLTRLIVHH